MMAEDNVDLSVTPEITKRGEVELRRHSTGKASSGNSEEKVLARYLRASTGSCHDFCKYGRKHALEANESRSTPKRVPRKLLPHGSGESIGRTNISVAELRASADSKPVKKALAVKLRASVGLKPEISEIFGMNKNEMPTKSLESSKQVEKEVPENRKKTSLAKAKPVSNHLKSHDLHKTTRQEIPSTSKKVEASSKSNLHKMRQEIPSTSKKVEASSKSNLHKMRQEIPSTSKKVEASSKSTAFKAKQMKVSSKPKSLTVKTTSSRSPSDVASGQRNSELNMEKRAASSKVSARKLTTPSRNSFSLKPSLNRVASINARKHKSTKIVSHPKNQTKDRKGEPKQHSDVEAEEKTLYVIKMDGEDKTLQSDQNASHDVEWPLPQSLASPKFSSSTSSQSSSKEDQEVSECTTSEVEEDSFPVNDETEHIEEGEISEVEQKGKPRKDSVVFPEDKDCSQMSKLKFIRGRWVEIKSEKSSPRRLKFRRGRVLEVNANAKDEAQRKSYKRRDGDVAESNDDATNGPEKVVLRHQDVQGKKDEQGLFNNVIEETASKLAETRKSKVKALVGAFETVISLQEKKPSANTVS